MKKLYPIVLITVLMASGRLYGQTNVFPSSGNVGIGTTSPAEALTVNGKIQIGHANWISYRPGDKFTHDSSLQPHYGIQWINDSQDSDGSMMWVSGYAGIKFFTAGRARIRVDRLGNVGIGTTTPTYKLEVNGTIRAKEIKLEANNWPDYVFDDGYQLMPLEEVKAHIDQQGHLPGLKSAREYEAEGVNVMELNQKLLEKIEELTLHLINQHSLIGTQKEKLVQEHERNIEQDRKIDALEMELRELKSLLQK